MVLHSQPLDPLEAPDSSQFSPSINHTFPCLTPIFTTFAYGPMDSPLFDGFSNDDLVTTTKRNDWTRNPSSHPERPPDGRQSLSWTNWPQQWSHFGLSTALFARDENELLPLPNTAPTVLHNWVHSWCSVLGNTVTSTVNEWQLEFRLIWQEIPWS